MEELLTLTETAKELRISPFTVRAWVFQRRIPSVKLGRRVLFRRVDLENLVARNLRGAEEKSRG